MTTLIMTYSLSMHENHSVPVSLAHQQASYRLHVHVCDNLSGTPSFACSPSQNPPPLLPPTRYLQSCRTACSPQRLPGVAECRPAGRVVQGCSESFPGARAPCWIPYHSPHHCPPGEQLGENQSPGPRHEKKIMTAAGAGDGGAEQHYLHWNWCSAPLLLLLLPSSPREERSQTHSCS